MAAAKTKPTRKKATSKKPAKPMARAWLERCCRVAIRLYKHPVTRRIAAVLAVPLLVYIWFQVSPRPGAFIIKAVFDQGSHKTLQAMEEALPSYPVAVVSNQQYLKGTKAAQLDVYIPRGVVGTSTTLPVVIWTHGGGWLSGDKTNDAPYFERLASQGYVVVALNYSLAPGKTFPMQLFQMNSAYSYLAERADQYHINMQKVVLAGDSAGAQLASEMAAIITNPTFAAEMKMQPALKPSQLSAVILYCGIYKMAVLDEPSPSLPKIIDWGTNTTVWAYAGKRHPSQALLQQMSAYYHATAAFPKTFISGGNGDALTNTQSVPFSYQLQSMGVNVTSLFYPADHVPKLPHEYQFTFDDDGENAFAQMTDFLAGTAR